MKKTLILTALLAATLVSCNVASYLNRNCTTTQKTIGQTVELCLMCDSAKQIIKYAQDDFKNKKNQNR